MGLAVAVIAAITLVGWTLRLIAPGALPAALLFPAMLLVSLIGGWRAGVAAGALALIARAWPFGLQGSFALPPATALPNYLLFIVGAAGVIAIGAYARTLVDRLQRSRDVLADQELNYRTLFGTMTEGFAICEAIRDEAGQLVDYTVVEINPALQRMLNVGPDSVGARLGDTPGNWTNWLSLCNRVLTGGEPISFERYNRASRQWHEVHLSRLTETRMAQFFFDITERKAGEAKQAELFDELNHRVKNNLAMVAGLLQLQARGAPKAVSEQLIKAAARVQGIAEVHDALSRGASREAVDFGAYLQDLCATLRRTLMTDERIHLGVETESVILSVDVAIPLGMVVNELVTNSVKYAYPAGQSGTIDVGFRRDKGQVTLSVRDLGPGLPAGIVRGDGGLGMRLVRSLIDQIGADLTIAGGEGAEFEIRLPADG
ncbi:MAG TPA: sensor histidine kinase [Caulobacteraceae bacterium]|nr:sensor histidine kinase [Caulobacteraceae bacterium]